MTGWDDTPRDQAVRALREIRSGIDNLIRAIEDGALERGQAKSEFVSVEEACRALGIGAVKYPRKALIRKTKGRGYVRRDGYGLIIERKGLLQHVRSMGRV